MQDIEGIFATCEQGVYEFSIPFIIFLFYNDIDKIILKLLIPAENIYWS